MRYKFKCDVTVKDCWYLYMRRIYHTMVGVVSLVLAVSLIALTVAFWSKSNILLRIVLLFSCLLVPVIQPLGVYLRSVKMLENLPKDMELWFGDKGIYVKVGEQTDNISWKKVRHVVKEANMVMIIINDGRGYMLTDRVLGDAKEAFYQYAASCIS